MAGISFRMELWTLAYLRYVLKKTGWSPHRLSTEAGVAASTINRPLRDPDWSYQLSHRTIERIAKATSIDPTPFSKGEANDDTGKFHSVEDANAPGKTSLSPSDASVKTARTAGTHGSIQRTSRVSRIDPSQPQELNSISFSASGGIVTIFATLDRTGIDQLKSKLDSLADLLDEQGEPTES